MLSLSPEARRLAGHAALVMAAGLIAGFCLGFVAIGGFILDPLPSARFDFPGSEKGWRAMHVGSLLNGVMAMAVAGIIDRAIASAKARAWIANGLVFAIWANTVFYLFANFAANRGLSPWDNAAGPGNLAGLIAFTPAAFGAFLSLILMLIFAKNAFSGR